MNVGIIKQKILSKLVKISGNAFQKRQKNENLYYQQKISNMGGGYANNEYSPIRLYCSNKNCR